MADVGEDDRLIDNRLDVKAISSFIRNNLVNLEGVVFTTAVCQEEITKEIGHKL